LLGGTEQRKRSTLGVAALAVALSACGDRVAGLAVSQASARSAIAPDAVVVSHHASFGFADFPTWIYVLFDHDYPKRMHKKGVGHTFLDVAAADIPGWYMTVYEGCG
jgi:hypothetical protein